MMKKFILYLMAICLAIPLIGQTVTIQDVPDAEPGIVEVTISMTDFGNPVNAISLIFPYDANLISYEDHEFHFPGELATISYNSYSEDKMSIQWASTAGVSINGDFITILFKYNGGFNTTLEFIELECEITYNTTDLFDVTYVAGNITADLDNPDGIISIGPANAIAGDPVDVPINITGFDQTDKEAHAITLRIGYDTDKLSFNHFSSNSLGFTEGSPVNGVLTLVVAHDDDPLIFDNPVVELNFTYLGGGPADIEFLPGSLVANDEAETLITEFVAGQVISQMNTGELIIEKVIADGATIEDLFPDPPGGEQLVPEAVTVDITAEGLDAITDMGMISLEIEFDADLLVYDGFIPSSLPGLAWVVTQSEPGRLSMQKTSDTNFTLDGVFMTLKFNYLYVPDPDTDGLAFINWRPGTFLQRNDLSLTFVDPELEDGWVNTGYELDVKVFLEGPYNVLSGLMETGPIYFDNIPTTQPYGVAPWNFNEPITVPSIPTGVIDWILVELRDADTPANADQSTQKWIGALFLMEDGSVVDFDGVSAPVISIVPDDNIYVVIRHRNHVGIMSAVGMTIDGGKLIYDFTTPTGQAYKEDQDVTVLSQKELSTNVYGMFAGDVTDDGINNFPEGEINVLDLIYIYSNYDDLGYQPGDIDFDGEVGGLDMFKSYLNSIINIGAIIP